MMPLPADAYRHFTETAEAYFVSGRHFNFIIVTEVERLFR